MLDSDLMRRLFVGALLAAASLVHADPFRSGGSGSVQAAAPVVVLDGDGARVQKGNLVAVKGTARDAKIAAAVVADKLVVYCLGLESWPSGMSGKPVVVHGRLEQTEEFVAKRDPTGKIGAGTDGPVWVLRGCRYEVP